MGTALIVSDRDIREYVISFLFIFACTISDDFITCFLHLAGVAVVYDSVEVSPFYSNTQGDMYLDEKDLIELQSPHSDRAG